MKRLTRFCALLPLLGLLCACGRLVSGSYTSVTPHEEQEAVSVHGETVYAVHNYAGMKSALQKLIAAGDEIGTLSVTDYPGSVSDDIAKACQETMRSDPLAAYAVDYLTHRTVRLFGSYEITVRITYKLEESDIRAVRKIAAVSEMFDLIDDALDSCTDSLTVQLATLSVTERSLTRYVESYYQSHPDRVAARAGVNVSFYPSEEDVNKIIHFRFRYRVGAEESRERLDALKQEADRMAELCSGLSERETAKQCCERLMIATLPSGRSSTAWDALVKESADSEGIAMAYCLLCRRCGLSCTLVEGRKDGSAHYWNIVRLGEDTYHVDCSQCAENGSLSAFLLCDDDIIGTYWWDTDDVPACTAHDPEDGPELRELEN